MKIGDKVRFLSSTGGGVIAGFKGKIVLVEDEDGFQIPTPANEVVVVEDAATDRAKLRIDQQQRKIEKGEDTRSIKQRLTATGAEEEEVGEDWRDVAVDKRHFCRNCGYTTAAHPENRNAAVRENRLSYCCAPDACPALPVRKIRPNANHAAHRPYY